MTEPIKGANTIFQNVRIALADDKKVSDAELQQIVAAVKARGGVAPRELAQARILAQNLYDVMIFHDMSPTYVAARDELAAAVAACDQAYAYGSPTEILRAEGVKLLARAKVAAAEIEVRATARDNQDTVNKIAAFTRSAYGDQWWITSFVLSLVYGGSVKLPEQDAALDPVGRVIR